MLLLLTLTSCDQTQEQKIDKAIEGLAGGTYASREVAMKELDELGEKAVPALLDSVNAKSPERRLRVRKLLDIYLEKVSKQKEKTAAEAFDRFFGLKKEGTENHVLRLIAATKSQKLKDQCAEALMRHAASDEVKEQLLGIYLGDPEGNKAVGHVIAAYADFRNLLKTLLFDWNQPVEKRKEVAKLMVNSIVESDLRVLLKTLTTEHDGKVLDEIGKQVVLDRLKKVLEKCINLKNAAVNEAQRKNWERYVVLIKTELMNFLSDEASEGLEPLVREIIDMPEDQD